MTPVCPFVKASRPDDASGKKPGETQTRKQSGTESKSKQESGETVVKLSSKCPFGYDSAAAEKDSRQQTPKEGNSKEDSSDSAVITPKCPYGFDSDTFKIGPLSCLICKALLFDCSKCIPCAHVFCKICVSRFKDCPLCGADIEKIEPETNLQSVVDRFIEGHARIKRSQVNGDQEEAVEENKRVIYEDVSLERGSFLVQQAMRAFRANNIESAKSRLNICADDIREQLERMGNTSELCSQLGAVLGMLGDCCRANGDAVSAIKYFEESVNFLSKVPKEDFEVTHTLSVSLNKIGDLKYYGGDLHAARNQYFEALGVRQEAQKNHPSAPSQVLDVAISLAKVADVDRNIGNEASAIDEFQEAIKLLESLTISSEEVVLEKKRASVLEFVNNQLTNKPESVS